MAPKMLELTIIPSTITTARSYFLVDSPFGPGALMSDSPP